MNVDARWLTIIDEFEKGRSNKLDKRFSRQRSDRGTTVDQSILSKKFKVALVASGAMLAALLLTQLLII